MQILSKEHLDQNLAKVIAELYAFAEAGGGDVEFVKAKKRRTIPQNSSLHQYCDSLAINLNDAGYDMKRTLKQEVDIPWTKESVKEHLWKPIQLIVAGFESTADADTCDYSAVYLVLSRHLSQKFGVYVPWPSNRG